jgi:hypothetical protein
MTRQLSDLVTDWGGFEKLVAQLHETGDVVVEHDVTLTGRSGAPRQIDVLVRHRHGLYEHLIVVECKYRNKSVERLHVDALATTVQEVGAARGVIFTTKGFQEGAIKQAVHSNISVFKLREPTEDEWGLPGRHLDLWLHVLAIGIGNPQFPGAFSYEARPDRRVVMELEFGFPVHGTHTPLTLGTGQVATLEWLVERVARQSARELYRPRLIEFVEGETGEVRTISAVIFRPEKPLAIKAGEIELLLPEVQFDLGLCVYQSRVQIDRGERYAFVLAIEDCINGAVSTASRERDASQTTLSPVGSSPSGVVYEPFKNGSVAQIWIGPFEQFEKFKDAKRGRGGDGRVTISLEKLLSGMD